MNKWLASITMMDGFTYSITKGFHRIEWDYIGEGWQGDYNPDDPDDVPLLRFTMYENDEPIDDGSYCTLLPIDTKVSDLKEISEHLLNACSSSWRKRRFEELTYWTPKK